jgi:hypothetical protein
VSEILDSRQADRLQTPTGEVANRAWIGEPRHHTATREEAIRRAVLSHIDAAILAAGGFDAIEEDPWHDLHEIYDDLGAVRRDYETVVGRCRDELGDGHFVFHPEWVELSPAGDLLVNRRVKEVRETQPVLDRLDDPNYRWDSPDEIGVNGYASTKPQAIRDAILGLIAPDVAGAGGFPGVDRNPNHRRHCSPEGLKRLRRDYDAIATRADEVILVASNGFVQSQEFGWTLTPPAQDFLEEIVSEYDMELRRERGQGLSL